MIIADTLNPIAPSAPVVGPAALAGTAAGLGFGDVLREADAQAAKPDRLREAAAELVSVAMLLPMLKAARNDPFKSDLFHGGQGEEAFGAQLDQEMATRMGRSMKMPVIDAVYNRFARRTGEVASG
jgi:hypothetical protein